MKNKSLREDQNKRLRAIVRELVDGEFAGSATAAARAFGVAQSMVSEFLAGGRGAGPKLINGIAEYTGRSIDDLYGRHVVAVPDGSRAYQRLADHPDWERCYHEALERGSLAGPEQIRAAGEVAFTVPPEVLTPDFVIRIAEALATATPYRRNSST